MLTLTVPSETPPFCNFTSPSFFQLLLCFSHSPTLFLFSFHRELAKGLGLNGIIDFSQVEHVILKSMLIALFQYHSFTFYFLFFFISIANVIISIT